MQCLHFWTTLYVGTFTYSAVKTKVTNVPQFQGNKYVFSKLLKWQIVVLDCRNEAGKLFQSLGPVTWKALRPRKPSECGDHTSGDTR